jgi:hypothetical protein
MWNRTRLALVIATAFVIMAWAVIVSVHPAGAQATSPTAPVVIPSPERP